MKAQKIKEIRSPFSASDLELAAMNDRDTYESIQRHVSGIVSAIGRCADNLARANKAWHDDPESSDHALFHAPSEAQFPPSERVIAVAQCVLNFLVNTPAGLEVASRLKLKG